MPKKILERLAVELSADRARLGKDLNAAISDTKGFASRARKILGGALIIGGLGLAAREVQQLFSAQGKLIDQQAKFADVIGLSTEALAGYRLGASITGVELGQLQTGVTRLLKNVGDAGDGLAAPTRALEKLGLTFDDLKVLDTDQQIKLIADRFTGLESTINKSSVTLNLFGRSGVALGKLLETGAEGIARFQQEAEELGLAIGRIDAAKVEEANDSLTRLNALGEGFSRQLVVEISPAITEFSNDLINAAKEAGGLGNVVKDAFETIEDVALVIAAVLAGRVGGALAGNAISFAAANIEAIRYQATLARMAGVSRGAALGMTSISTATRGLRTAMAFLGGPLGVVVAAASAFALFSSGADDAGDSADTLAGSVDDLRKKLDELTIAQAQRLDLQVSARIDQLKGQQRQLRQVLDDEGTQLRPGVVIRLPEDQLIQKRAELDDVTQDLARAEEQRASILERINRAATDSGSADVPLKTEDPTLDKAAANELTALEKRLSLLDATTEKQRVLFEIEKGRFSAVADSRKEELLGVAARIDAAGAEKQLREELSGIEVLLKDDVQRVNEVWDARVDIIKRAVEEEDKASRLIAEAEKQRTRELADLAEDTPSGFDALFGEGGLDRLFSDFDNIEDRFKGMLAQMVAEAAVAQLTQALGFGGGQATGGGGQTASGVGFFASLFGGAFAEGGRPPVGKVSIVGDGGEPELFVPDTAGTIVPFSDLGQQQGAPEPMVIVVDSEEKALEALASKRGQDVELDTMRRRASEFRQALGI